MVMEDKWRKLEILLFSGDAAREVFSIKRSYGGRETASSHDGNGGQSFEQVSMVGLVHFKAIMGDIQDLCD